MALFSIIPSKESQSHVNILKNFSFPGCAALLHRISPNQGLSLGPLQ